MVSLRSHRETEVTEVPDTKSEKRSNEANGGNGKNAMVLGLGAHSLAIWRGPLIAMSGRHAERPSRNESSDGANHRLRDLQYTESSALACSRRFTPSASPTSCASTDSRLKQRGCVPLIYKGVPLEAKSYVDFVVENRVVVELKAVSGGREDP